MSVLKAAHLYKRFGKRLVVKDISLSLETGHIYGLLGRNGAGKTTTFQIITGLIKPDSGKIYLDETDISSKPTHERALAGVTYLPQESSAFLKTSVLNNLLIVLREKGLSNQAAKEKAFSLRRSFTSGGYSASRRRGITDGCSPSAPGSRWPMFLSIFSPIWRQPG